MNFIKLAEPLLARGLSVFPVVLNGKYPLTPHGFKDATQNMEIIAKWSEYYGLCNIGVTAPWLVVLDQDDRNGGAESVNKLPSYLPKTFTVKSGGGYHRYYKSNIPTKYKEILPGLEIRNFITGPGSIHKSGVVYTVIDNSEIEEAPSWMVIEPPRAQKNDNSENDNIFSGQRNSRLASLGGTMVRRGMTFDSVLKALQTENELICKPPLSEAEVYNIVKSIYRYK